VTESGLLKLEFLSPRQFLQTDAKQLFSGSAKTFFGQNRFLQPRKKTIGDARAFFPFRNKPDNVVIELFPSLQKTVLAKMPPATSEKNNWRRSSTFSALEKTQ